MNMHEELHHLRNENKELRKQLHQMNQAGAYMAMALADKEQEVKHLREQLDFAQTHAHYWFQMAKNLGEQRFNEEIEKKLNEIRQQIKIEVKDKVEELVSYITRKLQASPIR